MRLIARQIIGPRPGSAPTCSRRSISSSRSWASSPESSNVDATWRSWATSDVNASASTPCVTVWVLLPPVAKARYWPVDDDAVADVVGDAGRLRLMGAHEGPQGHPGVGELDPQRRRPDANAAVGALHPEKVLGFKVVNGSEHLVPSDLSSGEPPVLVSSELLKTRRSRCRAVLVRPAHEHVVEIDVASAGSSIRINGGPSSASRRAARPSRSISPLPDMRPR